jgi:hypothetical protein
MRSNDNGESCSKEFGAIKDKKVALGIDALLSGSDRMEWTDSHGEAHFDVSRTTARYLFLEKSHLHLDGYPKLHY